MNADQTPGKRDQKIGESLTTESTDRHGRRPLDRRAAMPADGSFCRLSLRASVPSQSAIGLLDRRIRRASRMPFVAFRSAKVCGENRRLASWIEGSAERRGRLLSPFAPRKCALPIIDTRLYSDIGACRCVIRRSAGRIYRAPAWFLAEKTHNFRGAKGDFVLTTAVLPVLICVGGVGWSKCTTFAERKATLF